MNAQQVGNLTNGCGITRPRALVQHNAAPTEAPGREGLKMFVTYAHAGFQDLHFTVDDQIAEGDKVVTRWTCTGIHQGEFAGVPATGKRVTFSAINIHRVVNNQIQEGWLNWDALSLLQQLGAIPVS
jgi:steroid delta-isomerase-like uncharacterized protein